MYCRNTVGQERSSVFAPAKGGDNLAVLQQILLLSPEGWFRKANKSYNTSNHLFIDKMSKRFSLYWVKGTKMAFCWQYHKARSNTLVCCCRPLPSCSLLVSVGRWSGPGQEGTAESSHCCQYLQSFTTLGCLSILSSFRWDGQINSHWHHCLLITVPINHNSPFEALCHHRTALQHGRPAFTAPPNQITAETGAQGEGLPRPQSPIRSSCSRRTCRDLYI